MPHTTIKPVPSTRLTSKGQPEQFSLVNPVEVRKGHMIPTGGHPRVHSVRRGP